MDLTCTINYPNTGTSETINCEKAKYTLPKIM